MKVAPQSVIVEWYVRKEERSGYYGSSFYDAAYDLEKALRNSDEYSRLRGLYDQVNADESAKRMFDNFRNVQLQLQQKQMSGEEITQEEVEQAQNRCSRTAA